VTSITETVEVVDCPESPEELQAQADERCAAKEAEGFVILRCEARCENVPCEESQEFQAQSAGCGVNTVIFDIDFVRATEDPEPDEDQPDSPLDDGLLDDILQDDPSGPVEPPSQPNELTESTDEARSIGFENLAIPAALPSPPPYDPEISPEVEVQVTAQLADGVSCDDLSGEELQNLAVGYCLKILELSGINDTFVTDKCSASCGSSEQSEILQVNPVLFDIEFLRANEDPAAVDEANKEVKELERIFVADGLLSTALEQTLPGTTVASQEVSTRLVEQSEGPEGEQKGGPAQGALQEATSNQTSTESSNARDNCTDVPTPDEYTCEQQKGWGKCTSDFMLQGDFCAKACGRCGGTKPHCTDVPTPDEYTCEQQKGWGKCTADFMLQGDFCAKTCGRC
jgi:hypothetical protein